MPKKITDLAVGGQAVIEGVMMRDAHRTATAVRLPNGDIDAHGLLHPRPLSGPQPAAHPRLGHHGGVPHHRDARPFLLRTGGR